MAKASFEQNSKSIAPQPHSQEVDHLKFNAHINSDETRETRSSTSNFKVPSSHKRSLNKKKDSTKKLTSQQELALYGFQQELGEDQTFEETNEFSEINFPFQTDMLPHPSEYQLAQIDPRPRASSRPSSSTESQASFHKQGMNYTHPSDTSLIQLLKNKVFESIEDLQDFAIPQLFKGRNENLFEIKRAQKYIQLKCVKCKYFLLWFDCKPVKLTRVVHSSHKYSDKIP